MKTKKISIFELTLDVREKNIIKNALDYYYDILEQRAEGPAVEDENCITCKQLKDDLNSLGY